MLNSYRNQKNYIPQQSDIQWNTQGYSSIGMDVTGTFTSGSFTLVGSNDGTTWTLISAVNEDGPVTNSVITETGHYTFDVLGYNIVKLVESSLDAEVELSSLLTVEVAGAFSGGGSGGTGTFDELILPEITNAALATDSEGVVYGVTGESGDVMRLSGTGSIDLVSIASDGTTFVAAGATSGKIYTSPDAITWQEVSTPSAAQLTRVVWNGSTFLAIGLGGIIWTSPTGTTWTARTSGVATNLSGAAWDSADSQWIVVGSTQTVLTSPTAATWTSRTYGTTNSIRNIANNGTVSVAVGTAGVIKTSPDGVTWTLRTSGVATELNGAIWDSTNSQFVVTGASGVILTSPDGTTWTPRTSGVSTAIYFVDWNGTRYTAVGASGVILSSTDGVTWSAETSGVTEDLFGAVYAESQWVVVGAAGIRLTSPDGDTWTLVESLVWANSTPSGTGPLLARDGDKTINGTNAYTGASTFSATLVAANGIRVTGATATSDIMYDATNGVFIRPRTAGSADDYAVQSMGGAYLLENPTGTNNIHFNRQAGTTLIGRVGNTTQVLGALTVGTGASGTFTTADAKTVTVTNGIITSIV